MIEFVLFKLGHIPYLTHIDSNDRNIFAVKKLGGFENSSVSADNNCGINIRNNTFKLIKLRT